MARKSIVITEPDMRRLRDLIGTRDALSTGTDLERELDRAIVVSAATVRADVVTLNSRVRVRNLDSGLEGEYTLVLPAEAEVGASRVSVLAPLGMAILGYRAGDEILWPMPAGPQRLRIDEVVHQPEAARRAALGMAAYLNFAFSESV